MDQEKSFQSLVDPSQMDKGNHLKKMELCSKVELQKSVKSMCIQKIIPKRNIHVVWYNNVDSFFIY